MKVIEIDKLVKKFDDFVAIDNISLSIDEGEIYGLLGPNGAGKSTTISTICGLVRPSSGDIKIMGTSIKKHDVNIKRKIGNNALNITHFLCLRLNLSPSTIT